MSLRFHYLCGMIAPILFIFMTLLGGALRPGYSHLSETVSELFSPGSPNKLFLDALHSIFALLLVLFGVGILRFVRRFEHVLRIGSIGASFYIAMGVVSVLTATIFPQDAWGSPPTFAGEMHKILSGAVGLLSLLAMCFLGVWFRRAGLFPWFAAYTFITVGFVIISTAFFVASMSGPFMGLTERITIFFGFLWTFILAWWMLFRSGEA